MKFCADDEVASRKLDTEAEKPELSEVLARLLLRLEAALPVSAACPGGLDMVAV